jgi:hypothetical protein
MQDGVVQAIAGLAVLTANEKTMASDLGIDVQTLRPILHAFELAGLFERERGPTNAPH